MTISFFAYHRDEARRQNVIARMETLCREGRIGNAAQGDGTRMGLLAALGDGAPDLPAAHHGTGFTAPLLHIADAIFEGLPPEEAPPFAIALVRAAHSEADIGDVPEDFLQALFAATLDQYGPAVLQRLVAARSASLAGQRGRAMPLTGDALVAKARDVALERAGSHVGAGLALIASLDADPADCFRRYARDLLDLLKAA